MSRCVLRTKHLGGARAVRAWHLYASKRKAKLLQHAQLGLKLLGKLDLSGLASHGCHCVRIRVVRGRVLRGGVSPCARGCTGPASHHLCHAHDVWSNWKGRACQHGAAAASPSGMAWTSIPLLSISHPVSFALRGCSHGSRPFIFVVRSVASICCPAAHRSVHERRAVQECSLTLQLLLKGDQVRDVHVSGGAFLQLGHAAGVLHGRNGVGQVFSAHERPSEVQICARCDVTGSLDVLGGLTDGGLGRRGDLSFVRTSFTFVPFHTSIFHVSSVSFHDACLATCVSRVRLLACIEVLAFGVFFDGPARQAEQRFRHLLFFFGGGVFQTQDGQGALGVVRRFPFACTCVSSARRSASDPSLRLASLRSARHAPVLARLGTRPATGGPISSMVSFLCVSATCESVARASMTMRRRATRRSVHLHCLEAGTAKTAVHAVQTRSSKVHGAPGGTRGVRMPVERGEKGSPGERRAQENPPIDRIRVPHRPSLARAVRSPSDGGDGVGREVSRSGSTTTSDDRRSGSSAPVAEGIGPRPVWRETCRRSRFPATWTT